MKTYIYPFSQFQDDIIPKPYLPVRIVNTHNNCYLDYLGLVDTGADSCMVPAWLAKYIGHDIQKGKESPVSAANGHCVGYYHAITMLIRPIIDGEVDNSKSIFSFDSQITCLGNGHNVLLGVREFLINTVLHIDYTKLLFSISLQ